MRSWMALAIVTVAAGCGSNVTEPSVQETLTGVWVWLDSSGGFAGTTRTPETEGYDQTLRFTRSDVGLFRDGVIQAQTDYTFSIGTDRRSGAVAYDAPLFGFDTSIVDLISPDTLILTDPCCDGFMRRWVR